MIRQGRLRLAPAFVSVLLGIASAACGTSAPSPAPSAPSPSFAVATTPSMVPSSSLPAASIDASLAPGFAFDPESIVGYYQSIGFACSDRVASTTAAGHEFQSCQLVDPSARTLTLGIVTDPRDNVADAFLSVRGSDAETVLDPADVLEPFGAFLGAFLGVEQGSEVLPWLASHLGDADARTTVGDMTIATYTSGPEDHAKLTVEIATGAYLDAPRPSSGGG